MIFMHSHKPGKSHAIVSIKNTIASNKNIYSQEKKLHILRLSSRDASNHLSTRQ